MKIADFGFAAPSDGRDGKGILETYLGTLNYMAPEIHLQQPYDGRCVDVFAAGVILFMMVSAHQPFDTAEPQDPYYRCVAATRCDIFWRVHSKNKESGEEFYSESLKNLIQAMLQLDASHRPTIPEIFGHPWMQGPIPTEAEVIQEF